LQRNGADCLGNGASRREIRVPRPVVGGQIAT